MDGPAWNTDPVGADKAVALIARAVLTGIVADGPRRRPPTVAMPARWHRQLYEGVPVPSASYLGNPRDSDPAHPDLFGYEVGVGARQGLPSSQVPGALARFVSQLRRAVATFDAVLAVGSVPSSDDDLLDVVTFAASAHGEWVRIHPYANGNGRTARLWANWVAVRYGLPPFVAVKPRPSGLLYETAATASMGVPPSFAGDHDPTVAAFVDMLHSHLTGN